MKARSAAGNFVSGLESIGRLTNRALLNIIDDRIRR